MNKNFTLLVGKNSFVGKSMSLLKKDIDYVSFKDVDNINFSNFKNIILCSQPPIYYLRKEKNFNFEKKIFKKITNQKIIFLSSSKVYPNKLNCSEITNVSPQNIYGENKLELERVIKKNVRNYLILRVSNLFSHNSFSNKSFLDILKKNAKNNRILFDYSISSVKDFISIKIFIKMISDLMNQSLSNQTFNIGCGNGGFKVIDIIKIFLGKKFDDIKIIKDNDKKMSQTLSISKLISCINISKTKNEKIIIRDLKKCGKFYF